MSFSPSAGRLRGAGRRTAAAVALAALACGPTPGAGAAEPAPALTATTELTAAGSGYAPVRLTAPMTIDLLETPAPQITVSDPATFVALVLVQVPESGPPTGPMLEVVAMPAGQTTRYLYGCGGVEPETDQSFCSTGVLPAGDYRLYVLATGRQQVVVQLPAPAGTQSLAAAIPAISHSAVSAAPGLSGTLVAPTVSAGGEFSLPHRWGLLIDADWRAGSDVVVREQHLCFYGASTVSTLAAPAPAPVCPGGIEGTAGTTGYAASENRVGGGYTYGLEPGTFGIKMTDEYGGAIENAAIRLMWLDWG